MTLQVLCPAASSLPAPTWVQRVMPGLPGCSLGRLPAPRRLGCRGCGAYGLAPLPGALLLTLYCDAALLAFEESSRCSCRVEVYRFESLGGAWRGGGASNAVAVVDDQAYTGGYLEQPVATTSGVESRRLLYVYRYVAHGGFAPLWSQESPGDVLSLVYNPPRDTLLAVLGEGHPRPGVYEVSRTGARLVAPISVAAGAMVEDGVCFAHEPTGGRVPSLTCLDPLDYRGHTRGGQQLETSVDGHMVDTPKPYVVAPAPGRGGVMVAARGMIAVYTGDGVEAYRFMDLPGYRPARNTAPAPEGAPLLLYTRPGGPSIVVEARRPTPRIRAVIPGEATSLAYMGGSLVAAARSGCERSLALVRERERSLSIRFTVADKPVGGVPLEGYREPRLTVYTEAETVLTVYGYDLEAGPAGAEAARYRLAKGANVVDLSDMRGLVVSMKLDSGRALARLHLE